MVRDLGSLVVEVGSSTQPPPGKKPAAVLAMLTIHAGQRVSTDALTEALWGDEVTSGAISTLESHVWRLRRQLEPRRRRGEAPEVLLSDAGGYRLLLGPDQIDSNQLERMVDDARGVLGSGRGESALELLDAAVRLWRGRPYSPFSDTVWAMGAVARLEETYLQAQELRVDALLEVGRTADALVDSETLMLQAAYAERPCAQRMLALHRSGRSDEALSTFRGYRRRMLDDLGLEPSPELTDLQRRILDHDSTLLVPHRVDTGSRAADTTHLPGRPSALIGRDTELLEVQGMVEAAAVLTIVGPAGCGKTRLAIDVARTLAPRFPEGVWFVELGALDDARAALGAVVDLLALSVNLSDRPAEALAAHLANRRILLVLDNCEHLLPGLVPLVEQLLGGPTCLSAILATSREPLQADGERIFSLEPLALPDAGDAQQWPPSASVELFIARASSAAPTLDVEGDALRTIESICVGLDGLPLALELAAARVRTYTLEEIADQVRRHPVDLSRLGGRGRDDRHQSVGQAIDWSVQLLGPTERRAHEALSVLPGRFTTEAARALTEVRGAPPEANVEAILPMLVNRSLLAAEAPAYRGGRTTFRQLATVRTHAAGLLETARTERLLGDRDSWVLGLLASGPRLGRPETAAFHSRIEDDYPTVLATLQRSLADRRDPTSASAPAQLLPYWLFREQLSEGLAWLSLGAEVADETGVADGVRVVHHAALAHVLALHGRLDTMRTHVGSLTRLLPGLTEPDLEAAGDLLPWTAVQAAVAGDSAIAVDVLEGADVVCQRSGDPYQQAHAAAARCMVVALAPGPDLPTDLVAKAREVYGQAMEVEHLLAAWLCCNAMTVSALRTRSPMEGLPWAKTTIALWLRLGARRGYTWLEVYADLLAMTGRWHEAAQLFAAAQGASSRVGIRFPRLPVSRPLYAATRATLSRTDFDRAWQTGQTFTLEHLDQHDPI